MDGLLNGKNEIVEGFVQRSMQLVKEGASFNIVNFITEGAMVVIKWSQGDGRGCDER